MPLVAIPNISVSEMATVSDLASVVDAGGARVLDVHVDAEHGRSVLTCSGTKDALVHAMAGLAVEACAAIRLDAHKGAHPRVGVLDVCPFVPHDVDMDEAVDAARKTARRIGAAGIPVFLYGAASDASRSLPEIRASGLPGLLERVAGGLEPDEGPPVVDPATGAACVGARDVLIAFNIWIDGDLDVARQVAARIRAGLGGLPGVRALGLDVSAHGRSQISMNLIAPETTGIERVFERVEQQAAGFGCKPVATEIVGLVPERFLPEPDAKATRLLIEPGRSLESALRG